MTQGNIGAHLLHPRYRADIDGLRAVAVVSVLLFHAFPSLLPGGFVGVDVFFVISGYLISTIIFSSLDAGRFSFREFYGRRIRRIFPSLVALLAASFIAGWFLLLASEFELLGKHIAGAAAFVSNFVLLGESGYFDEAATSKPLLHLWSLAVEEQFYLLWPLAAWGAWKSRLNLTMATVALAVLSFIAGVWLASRNPVLGFYGPHARFWELLIGALLAKWSLDRARVRPDVTSLADTRPLLGVNASSAASLAGALLLLVSILAIREDRGFPGWQALGPTVATALMIAAGPTTWVARTLSTRPLVWVGRISYPLYLWHWPLLSIAHIIEGTTPPPMVRLALLGISVVLAWATFRFVENPLRFRLSPRAAISLLLTAMGALLVLGVYTMKRDGFEFRAATKPVVMNEGDLAHDDFYRYVTKRSVPCTPERILAHAIPWTHGIRCFQTYADRPVDLALVGDSHAEHLYPGFLKYLGHRNVAVYIQNAPPFISNPQMKEIFGHVIGDASIRTVVISAWWRARQHEANEGDTFDHALLETVGALVAAGKKVYITDDGPEFPFAPSLCKFSRRWRHEQVCTQDAAEFMAQYDSYMRTLRKVGERFPQVTLIRTNQYFCSPAVCRMGADGELWYRDPHHLNIPGSLYIGGHIVADHPELKD